MRRVVIIGDSSIPITIPVGADQVIQLWPPKDHAVPISETVDMAKRLGADVIIVAGESVQE